jgi:hypothetical protein
MRIRMSSARLFHPVMAPRRTASLHPCVSLSTDQKFGRRSAYHDQRLPASVKVAFPQAVQDATKRPITVAVLKPRKQGYRVNGISEREKTNAPLAWAQRQADKSDFEFSRSGA